MLRLFEQLRQFGTYPPGVRAVDGTSRVRGTAFFPAGNGLWDPQGLMPGLPERPLMVVAHNFGDPAAMEDAQKRGMEDMSGATWRNLRRLLSDALVSEQRCFPSLVDGDDLRTDIHERTPASGGITDAIAAIESD